MEIVVVSDKDADAPAAVEAEEKPEVVVLVRLLLVVEEVDDQSDVVDREDCAQLYNGQLEAVPYHSFQG